MSDQDFQQEFLDTPAPRGEGVMYVDVKGYGGPLDLLLELARKQKVDLVNISVLALAEQYIAFIDTIRERRIEIAADYLVMAAWLTYLKSRLMVPHEDDTDEPSGEEMAALLQFRLKRLEAMRDAAEKLINRPQLGRGIFSRGEPEPVVTDHKNVWEATYFDLLRAYAVQRERQIPVEYTPVTRTVWSLQDAEDILRRLIGEGADWIPLHACLSTYLELPEERATALASSFTASLEMVRQGQLEVRQSTAFAPLMLRRKSEN